MPHLYPPFLATSSITKHLPPLNLPHPRHCSDPHHSIALTCSPSNSFSLLLRAIEHYERSETARVEIPRMLFSLGKMDILEDYVHKSSDEILLKVQPTTLTVTLSLALPLRQLSTVTIMATASLNIMIA